ncbi:MAG: hypothetical protein U0989_17465 [Azonexus sp.]|nr:hypothetical protein [Azonexus sp.]MDZ4316543.1 hypothetical protein [Azonexus sp.]
MDKLKKEFLLGFKEGWIAFWSPFSELFRAISATWHRHIIAPREDHN